MPQRVPTREEVQVVISALLVTRKEASTSGVPIVVLDNDYREQEGMRIPFRVLGHSCLLDCLQSMSSCLSVRHRNGVSVVYPLASEKTAHVSSLVARQKTSFKKPPRGGRRPIRPSTWFPRVSQPPRRLDSKILSDIVRMARNRPNGLHKDEVLQYIKDRLNYDFEPEDLKLQLREVNHEIVVDRDVIYPVSNYSEPAKNLHNSGFSGYNWDAPKNGAVDAPKKHCNYRAAGSSDSEDEDDFTLYRKCSDSRVGTTNDNTTTGSTKLYDNNNNDSNRINTGEAEPDVKGAEHTEYTEHTEHTEAQRDAVNHNDEECETGDPENIGMLISERTRFRLEKLVQNHPEGIWCAELPDVYLKEYKFPLNYEELGFSSVSDFAAYLPDVFHSVQLQDKGDFKLFDAKSVRPDLKQSERPSQPSMAALYKIYEAYGEEDVLPVPVVLPNETCQKLVPEGVVRLGETVPQICVTELDRGVNEYIDVVVVEIFTPSFFWIHLLKRTPKFEQFMADLGVFYTANANKYVMPIILMERGMNCACKYDSTWHRGIIKTVKHDSTVTVMFYDYGTVQSYPPEEIHFLHRKFSALPAQAIPCGLYNIKPRATDKWLKSVTIEFTWKVLDKPLVATIAVTDADNNSMLIGLTNTEGTEDFHINDWMVEKGYAVYGKMGDTVDMNDTCTYDPAYTEPNSSQPLRDGVRKPPGLSLGGLDPILEESDNNAVDLANEMRLALKQLQAVVDELRRDNEELLKWKRLVSERVLLDETTKSLQNSQPPLIPPMPKECTFSFASRSEKTAPFANGNVDSVEQSPIAIRELPAPAKAPSSPGKSDASMNLNDGFVHKNTIFPTFNFSNSATPTFAPQVPTSFNFSGTSSSAAQVFRYSAPTCEPTPRRKFEDSLESTVKNFFERSEKRQSAKIPVAATSPLPDSNPFRIHLGSDVDFERRRKTALPYMPPPLPPPLPPRSSPAKKPWENLMGTEAREQPGSSATKLVYEAAPIIYDTSSKAANHPSTLGPAFPEQEDFASSGQEKLTAALVKTCQTWREDFAELNQKNSSLSERFNSPSGMFINNCPETPEERNLRLFNESYSAQRSRSSAVKESTTSDFPTNVKAAKKDPPPLPPRPITFDFNSLSLREQNRYTDWLQASQYSDIFKNDESLVRNGWKCMNENDVKTVESAVNHEVKGAESIDRESSLNTAEAVMREITPKRLVHAKMEDEKDLCQFKAYPLPHRTIYIFNLDDEGWLATEEFAAEFTNFHALTMINILKTMSIFIPYRILSRSENRRFFEKLERTSLGVARDEDGKIGEILHLTPLRSTMKILRKLRLITDDEVQRAMKEKIYPEEPKTLLHIVMVIQEYSKFHQSLQSSNFGPM